MYACREDAVPTQALETLRARSVLLAVLFLGLLVELSQFEHSAV